MKRTGVRVRGNSIQIYFEYLGKVRYETLKFKKVNVANQNAAALLRERIVTKIKEGTFDYLKEFPHSQIAKKLYLRRGGNTVGGALDEWLDSAKSELKHSTWIDYRNSVDVLKREFGDTLLPKLAKKDIVGFIKRQDISQKRATNLLIPLRHVLREAVEDGVIDVDVLRDWKPRIQKKAHKSEINPFTKEEQLLLKGDSEIQAFIQFCIWTGLRTGEALALEWDDIDDDVIHITKSLSYGVVSLPKTKAGIRDVSLRPKAREALKLMAHTRFKKGRVFTFKTDSQVRKQFVQLCKRTGVAYRKPYNTRHTFASMMLSAGENAMWVAHQMGHSDVNMIARVYGHYIPSDRNEGSLADSMFGE